LRILSLPYFVATAVLAGAFAGPALAQTPVGTLQCIVSPSSGNIIESSRQLDCAFHSVSGYTEQYAGSIGTFGLDLGFTQGGQLSWTVVMATPRPVPYGLAGHYTGVSGGLTVGGGVSGNVLVGGNNSSVSLQPLSVSTQTGLSLSAGVGELTLQPLLPPPPPPVKKKKHH